MTQSNPHSAIHNLQSAFPLNPDHLAAVRCTDRPLVMIVAGPGTGKTRTLIVRIAYLIAEKGVAPENVLAITFTNKAAGEMRERLEGLLGAEVAGRVTIKTFHAFGALLLREHAARLGLSPRFVILGDEERAALLRQACPELKAGEVEEALKQVSAAKSGVDVPGTSKGAWHVLPAARGSALPIPTRRNSRSICWRRSRFTEAPTPSSR